MLSAALLIGCSDNTGPEGGRDSGSATATQEISEGQGGESSGEHGSGGEGSESGSGGEEGSGAANILAPDETFDMVRAGARLILSYDAPSNSFRGNVENTTNGVLSQVRIEVHLSNGVELGPTTPRDMAPGEIVTVTLPATQASFTGWVAHAEVGGGGEGSQSGGECWRRWTFDMVRAGARLILSYDAPSNSFRGNVENTTNGVLSQVRIEVHLSNGVELGPTTPRDMAPGEIVTVTLPATQASFTGWVAHAEVGGGGEWSQSGGEGGGEHGGSSDESGGEHGSGGERRGGG